MCDVNENDLVEIESQIMADIDFVTQCPTRY